VISKQYASSISVEKSRNQNKVPISPAKIFWYPKQWAAAIERLLNTFKTMQEGRVS
jgi:hypothetical protein